MDTEQGGIFTVRYRGWIAEGRPKVPVAHSEPMHVVVQGKGDEGCGTGQKGPLEGGCGGDFWAAFLSQQK